MVDGVVAEFTTQSLLELESDPIRCIPEKPELFVTAGLKSAAVTPDVVGKLVAVEVAL